MLRGNDNQRRTQEILLLKFGHHPAERVVHIAGSEGKPLVRCAQNVGITAFHHRPILCDRTNLELDFSAERAPG